MDPTKFGRKLTPMAVVKWNGLKVYTPIHRMRVTVKLNFRTPLPLALLGYVWSTTHVSCWYNVNFFDIVTCP